MRTSSPLGVLLCSAVVLSPIAAREVVVCFNRYSLLLNYSLTIPTATGPPFIPFVPHLRSIVSRL